MPSEFTTDVKHGVNFISKKLPDLCNKIAQKRKQFVLIFEQFMAEFFGG